MPIQRKNGTPTRQRCSAARKNSGRQAMKNAVTILIKSAARQPPGQRTIGRDSERQQHRL